MRKLLISAGAVLAFAYIAFEWLPTSCMALPLVVACAVAMAMGSQPRATWQRYVLPLGAAACLPWAHFLVVAVLPGFSPEVQHYLAPPFLLDEAGSFALNDPVLLFLLATATFGGIGLFVSRAAADLAGSRGAGASSGRWRVGFAALVLGAAIAAIPASAGFPVFAGCVAGTGVLAAAIAVIRETRRARSHTHRDAWSAASRRG